ncbi:hypothetical protein HXX76_004598 [Chlamydomonas incerta]|uniref:Uncharacterized protein n=1 Tax=Chlamydomonas incerta TaxID=51695 RepID=A0A835TIX2_CHLIN|nr:hypothetical protein HXX76_004598 [Chlamydomonas incerta]|eukprot:KAG2439236.1 hypothetical protein HXX76_004598 [Chlamydomonas incerta]
MTRPRHPPGPSPREGLPRQLRPRPRRRPSSHLSQRARLHLHPHPHLGLHRPRRLRKYNGGEGQEDFSFRTGYDDPEALGWRYTGHDSRIGAAYYENDSGIKIDAFYNTGTIKMSHPRPAPPPGGQPRKGPPPTSYHTKLSAQRWRDVLTAPPPPEDEEDDSEALGEDELPFEFPRGYDDPVDLDWEYLGSEPALKLAIYQRLEPGGKGLKLHAYYTTASIKLVFARPNKRAPPEHPPVYFRRLRPAAWRRVLTDPRANLELGYLAEPRGSSSSSSNRQQQHQGCTVNEMTVDEKGNEGAAVVEPKPTWKERWAKAWPKIQDFVVENYLVIAFAIAVTFALAYPVPGRFLVNIVVLDNVHIIQEINMAIVFFISGLALNTSELKKALARESLPTVIFGFVMISLITPILGFAMREIPLTPPAFAVGLTIFCLVPTTLGIGIALVRSCKGNEAIALLLTVGTNMLGVFLMPPWLRFLFLNYDAGINLNIDIPDLLVKLSITILAPSILGKALRELFKPVEEFAKKYRTALSLLSTTNLAFIVWQTLSGARDLLFQQRAGMIVAVIVLAAAVHVFYLIVNYILIKFAFKPPIKEFVACVIMASQKSAPVAVTVISYVSSDPAQQGLLAIPAIVGQISQIFIGAALAKRVGPYVQKVTKAQEAAAKEAAAAAAPKDEVDAAEQGRAIEAADAAGAATAAAAAAPAAAAADGHATAAADGAAVDAPSSGSSSGEYYKGDVPLPGDTEAGLQTALPPPPPEAAGAGTGAHART